MNYTQKTGEGEHMIKRKYWSPLTTLVYENSWYRKSKIHFIYTGCSLKTGPLLSVNNSSSFHPILMSKLLNERYCSVPLAQLKTFIVKRLKIDEIRYLAKLFKIATISIDAFVDTSKWTVKFDYFYFMDYLQQLIRYDET